MFSKTGQNGDKKRMPTQTRKPVSWFKDVPQIRKDLGSESDLRNLGESIRVRQLSPVGATADGTPIYGFRRIMAARLVGLPDIAVTIYDEALGDDEMTAIQLTENIHRLDMNAYEKWQAFEDIRSMNPEWTAKELASFVKLDPSAVTKYLSPSKCIPAWQEALKQGQVGITDCYTASPLTEDQQLDLLNMKLAGASRDALSRAARQAKPQSSDDDVRITRITVPMVCGTKLVMSGKKFSLAEFVEKLGHVIEAARKGIKDKLDAKTWQSVMQYRASAENEGEDDV